MTFLFEAVPESIVRRYFLQVPALLNSLVSGFTVRVANTAVRGASSSCIHVGKSNTNNLSGSEVEVNG
jgi:hypothetical protein